MRKVSFWARKNITYSRFIIAGIYILLNILGFFVGDLLRSMGVKFNSLIWFITMLLALTGFYLYPIRKFKGGYKNFYKRQKFADGILITSTFFFIIFFSNTFESNISTSISTTFAATIMRDASPSTKATASKKETKKSFRKAIQEIRKKYQKSTKSQKTIYIILAVLAAAGLIFLMVALSCSIACSGSEALAFIVGVTGIGAIIFGLVKLIQRIKKGKPVTDKVE